MCTNRADRVLVHGHKLRLSTASRARHARQRRLSPSIGIAERVERCAVQASNGRLSSPATRLRSRGVVETADGLPSGSLRTLEYDWLAIVTCCNQCVLGRPDEGRVRKCSALDRYDCGRARVNNRNRRVMAFCRSKSLVRKIPCKSVRQTYLRMQERHQKERTQRCAPNLPWNCCTPRKQC